MPSQENFRKVILALAVVFCLLPFVNAPMALMLGLMLSVFRLKPQINYGRYTGYLLQAAIVLMGFGMNLSQVLETSKTGIGLTVVSVAATMSIGIWLGSRMGIDKKTSLLISSGTAICGGSAIAAVVPVIGAKGNQISFSLGVIFVLNAVALLLFPVLGHWMGLDQHTFGYWSAIAIHDTSSVVGAGATYGKEALEVATTVKLTRALWIIPLTIVLSIAGRGKGPGKRKVNIPWFIGLFVVAIIVAHLLPAFSAFYQIGSMMGQKGMVIALLFIGMNISIEGIKETGFQAFLYGIILWIIIGSGSLLYIVYGV